MAPRTSRPWREYLSEDEAGIINRLEAEIADLRQALRPVRAQRQRIYNRAMQSAKRNEGKQNKETTNAE